MIARKSRMEKSAPPVLRKSAPHDITDTVAELLPFYLPLPTEVMPERFYVGRDDRLFLRDDTNDVISQIDGTLAPSEAVIREFSALHEERRASLSHAGIAYRHVICPNKESALANYLPPEIVFEGHGPSYANQLLSAAASETTFYERRVVSKDGFFVSDSHWNDTGALAYLKCALSHFGEVAALQKLDRLTLAPEVRPWQGDLGRYAKIEPEPARWLRVKDPTTLVDFQGNLILEGNVRFQKSRRQCESPTRAVVLHDSFTFFLFKFLGEIYDEVLFIHGPDLGLDYVSALKPDVVWFLQVERFLPRLPRNDMDLIEWVRGLEAKKQAGPRCSRYLAELQNRWHRGAPRPGWGGQRLNE